MTEMILGGRGTPLPVSVDLEKLIGNHACIMSMAGGGKSGLIRKMLEETHGHVQQIVLDAEDEFYTLREQFDDYLIAGGEGGDCPATVANAKALARMLLETGINAVIQLNDLHSGDQERFVAQFIDEMMSAPRELWHPVLLVLDESHRFAPQEGYAVSYDAVKDLTSRGRKRGFTAILATQRMAKINKNVTGDVTNWMIGRVGQGTDRRVAADQLGFTPSSTEARELQTMAPRSFWAFGPAWAVPARLFRVDDTTTTIVKAGQARIPTPPAPEAMREIMASMAAAAAPPPEKSPAGADSGPSSASAFPDWAIGKDDHERLLAQASDRGMVFGMLAGRRRMIDEMETWLAGQAAHLESEHLMEETAAAGGEITERQRELLSMSDDELWAAFGSTMAMMGARVQRMSEPAIAPAPLQSQPIAAPAPRAVQHTPGPGEMMKMKRATVEIIAVYEKVWPRTLPWISAAKLAGVGLKSSQFKVYEPEAIASGQLERIGDGYRARRGVAGGKQEIIDAYRAQLSPAFRAIFDSIARAGVPGQTRAKIMEEAGVSPTSSTTSAALRQMQDDLFVEHRGGDLYGLTEAFQ